MFPMRSGAPCEREKFISHEPDPVAAQCQKPTNAGRVQSPRNIRMRIVRPHPDPRLVVTEKLESSEAEIECVPDALVHQKDARRASGVRIVVSYLEHPEGPRVLDRTLGRCGFSAYAKKTETLNPRPAGDP